MLFKVNNKTYKLYNSDRQRPLPFCKVFKNSLLFRSSEKMTTQNL